MTEPVFDVITMGRSSIDLYADQVGAEFVDIQSFSAFVGGCPTNIAVGCARLGLKTALLTAVGEDPVGDFILAFLNREGVRTELIPRKAGRRTSAVLLGIQPPDKFPLVFYRDNCADIALSVEDVDRAPLDRTKALLITGTGLSQEPSRTATLRAAERARAAGARVYLDLDFRLDQWPSEAAYGLAVRGALPLVDIAVGTEEEVKASASVGRVEVTDMQVSNPEVSGDLETAICSLFSRGLETLVLKRGENGAQVLGADGARVSAAPFVVEVLNILGAGDAFAAGYIYGQTRGMSAERSARVGCASGAIVVTRHGCANFMPTEAELLEFVDARGGL